MSYKEDGDLIPIGCTGIRHSIRDSLSLTLVKFNNMTSVAQS